jgi:hypothetical protein
VCLVFGKEVAVYVGERVWHPSQRLRQRRDGGLEMRLETSGRKELTRWILTWVPFPNPFLSLSSLRRPPRREGSASARAGAAAGRPADAPTALTGGPVLRSSTAEGGLGNPGPTVLSRDCPSLLLDE